MPVRSVFYGLTMQQLIVTERQYSEEATFWRNVLHRIIKIILYLTSGNTALRGHEHKNKYNPEQLDGEGTIHNYYIFDIRLISYLYYINLF